MKRRFLILLVLFSHFSYSQDNKQETDTSVIEIRSYPDFNSIGIFNQLKDESKTYYTELYYDTKKLKEQGIFIDGTAVGIWKEYHQSGKVKREIDYDKGAITYFDKNAFPFLEFQNSIKLKGDDLLKKIYGKEFFDTYVTWSLVSSAIYNNDESGDWTDEFRKRPTSFLLRYNLIIDGILYDDMIEFNLNSKGELFFPFQLYDDVKGFEEIKSKATFELTEKGAIRAAKKLGLIESDSSKAKAFLFWDYLKDKPVTQFNGQFRFYVAIKTNSIRDIHPKGRSSIVDKYDVYVFNPWTAEFIEKRKMKTVYDWEENSGSSIGLIPDE